MLATKIVLGLVLASLAAIQVSAIPDPVIQTAIAQATASVATSTSAATSAINIALASISNATVTLAALSTIADGYKILLPPRTISILVGLCNALQFGLPLWGDGGNWVLECINLQKDAITAIPNQSYDELQSCITEMFNQVKAYNADVLDQQLSSGTLGAAAANGFTNCTLTTESVTSAVSCISIVVTRITNRADIIAQNVRMDAAAVDAIMASWDDTLALCGGKVLYKGFVQSANITKEILKCANVFHNIF